MLLFDIVVAGAEHRTGWMDEDTTRQNEWKYAPNTLNAVRFIFQNILRLFVEMTTTFTQTHKHTCSGIYFIVFSVANRFLFVVRERNAPAQNVWIR